MPSQTCNICCSEVASLKNSPRACTRAHSNQEKACNECWEAHLSAGVEGLDPRRVQCIFCSSIIDRTELKRLARIGTTIRYDSKLQDTTRRFCQARCAKSVAHGLQSHDRQSNGRVFTCKFCNFKTCIDCDRPEHHNETCEQYNARVNEDPKHKADEEATKAAYKMCPSPSCCTTFEMEKGCGYTQCTACGFRFWGRCMIPWAGEDSAYLGGKAAHGEGCLYRTRDAPSAHGLKRRFEENEETKNRLQEKAEAKKLKREEKKAKANDVRKTGSE